MPIVTSINGGCFGGCFFEICTNSLPVRHGHLCLDRRIVPASIVTKQAAREVLCWLVKMRQISQEQGERVGIEISNSNLPEDLNGVIWPGNLLPARDYLAEAREVNWREVLSGRGSEWTDCWKVRKELEEKSYRAS